jgi:predicted ester cyclase
MMKNAITRNSLRLACAFAALAGASRGQAAEKPLTGQALADRYAACWQQFNNAQWDEFVKCYGPGTVSVAPGQPTAKGGPDIVDKHAKPIKTAMPDVSGELQLVVVSGRNAATVALMRGTHMGPLATPAGEIPPTRKRVGQLVAHAIESGPSALASKEWFVQDGGNLMAQLGLSKAPGRPALEKGAAERPVVVATGSAAEKANLATARKAYALFDRHDKKIGELLASDVVDHDQTVPADVHGHDAVAEHMAGLWAMSSNAKLATPVLFAAGDYTVAIGRITGKNDGDMPAMGLKKTGKAFNLDFVEFIRWKDGKIAEQWPFINSMQMAMQLGLIPPPSTTAQK